MATKAKNRVEISEEEPEPIISAKKSQVKSLRQIVAELTKLESELGDVPVEVSLPDDPTTDAREYTLYPVVSFETIEFGDGHKEVQIVIACRYEEDSCKHE